MDDVGRELLSAMKNQEEYDIKVATAIFITIRERVKYELYPMIEREIGKKRKKYLIPQYPNEIEKLQILKFLYQIPFTFAIDEINNFINNKDMAKNINEYLMILLQESLILSINEFQDLYRDKNDMRDVVEEVAKNFCNVVNIVDYDSKISIMVPFVNFLGTIKENPVRIILSCDEQDLIPTIYELCGE